MKFLVIMGSVRDNSRTKLASNMVMELFASHGHDASLLDPTEFKVGTLGGDLDSGTQSEIRDLVLSSDGVVLCTPEYHGNFSSVIMSLLENLDYPSFLAGKPVALVGVAAGKFGAVKALEHLRSVLSHCGAIVVPKVSSIAMSYQVLPDEGGCTDKTILDWTEQMVLELVEFADLFKHRRKASLRSTPS